MENNPELQLAWDFVENTGVSIFLTGKAGTGKTTFLREVKRRSPKRMVVVAPTGVAAINAGGQTIHSFFQLPLSPYVPETRYKERFDFSKEKKKMLRTLDLLVIDEISMVRSDLLDAIDNVMRRFRDPRRPFGGAQLLMIGDLQQLTPVVTPADEALLKNHYDTPYFFGSNALRQTQYVTLELKHVYRQQDTAFLDILNHIREDRVTANDIATLNQRCIPNFHPAPEEGYIRLTTHNHLADSYNESELASLTSKAFTYNAKIDGTFPDYAYPTDVELTLKQGAQVMFVKNDPEGRYYNGRIGRVTSIDNYHVSVVCPGDDKEISVEPAEWENAKYELNEKTKEIETTVQGTFRQLPLRLAWAITIHKSQGLTFEHAIIDAAFSFAAGQVYVALSRCKTLSGMVLAKPVRQENIMNDRRVASYIEQQETAAQRSIEMLPTLKEQFHREQLHQLFELG
jgi:ATP-dependent exoDNAse (exonuclease V) alpha subunit